MSDFFTKITASLEEKGKHIQKITSRPFVVPQHPVGDPKDPFAKDKIKAELQQRLNYISYPNQDRTSLCGPAAFFYCLQKSSPKDYERMVWELWKTGKTSINQLTIDVPRQTRRPHSYFRDDNGKAKISGIDWMTLGGLRGSSNTLMAYQSPDDDISAISTPNEIKEWFIRAGFTLVEEFILNNHENHIKMNEYFNSNHYIVSLVSSNILPQGKGPNLPNHWVVWSSTLNGTNGKPIHNKTKANENIGLTVFSWGEHYMAIKPMTYTMFKVRHHKSFVFRK